MYRILGTASLVILALPLAAQEPPDSVQMARMMELAQPGREHQFLARLAGTWDATFHMQGMTITGVAVNQMIVGGRYLSSSVTGAAAGMPFEALTILGFDRGPGVYTAVGFDTFGTYYVTAEGGWDDMNERIILAGSYNDPATGHAHDYEFVWTVPSPDRYTWGVVFLEGGTRRTIMEGEYRRR